MGSFLILNGQVKFLFVVVDYFTKFVEVQDVRSINQEAAQKFIFQFIINRFEIPQHIIIDNGTQFTGGVFTNMCNIQIPMGREEGG